MSPMSPSPPNLSSEEQEQLLQTIEMFEVIVQASPQDCQSMEILKDAYTKLGRISEMVKISRNLAEIYAGLGQLSSAVLEYEGILQYEPDNPEVIAALGEVEEKMQRSGVVRPPSEPQPSGINLDFRAVVADTGTLMTTANTQREGNVTRGGAARVEDIIAGLTEDGSDALGKFLIQNRLVSDDIVASALERVQKRNHSLQPNTFAASLLDELVRRGAAEMEALLCGILDRSKFAYIPLEYYDVDRQVVRLLPESIMFSRLMVPFDVISRTMMIATANPFDSRGKEAVQQILDYNIQWHLATPSAIVKILAESFRIPMPSSSEKLNGNSLGSH